MPGYKGQLPGRKEVAEGSICFMECDVARLAHSGGSCGLEVHMETTPSVPVEWGAFLSSII